MIRWSQHALRNLEQIHEYVRQDSVAQANKLIVALSDSTRLLETFPNSGRVVPEYAEHAEFRELISDSYRIQYRIKESTVEILAVVHGAKILPLDPPEFE